MRSCQEIKPSGFCLKEAVLQFGKSEPQLEAKSVITFSALTVSVRVWQESPSPLRSSEEVAADRSTDLGYISGTDVRTSESLWLLPPLFWSRVQMGIWRKRSSWLSWRVASTYAPPSDRQPVPSAASICSRSLRAWVASSSSTQRISQAQRGFERQWQVAPTSYTQPPRTSEPKRGSWG